MWQPLGKVSAGGTRRRVVSSPGFMPAGRFAGSCAAFATAKISRRRSVPGTLNTPSAKRTSCAETSRRCAASLPIFTLRLFLPTEHPVRGVDIGRHAVLAAPDRVFGHFHFLLDIVERLALLHRLVDPFQ